MLTGKPYSGTSYDTMSGAGVMDWINKAKNAVTRGNSFFKNTRAISKVTGVAADLTGNSTLRQASQYAARHGYGATAGGRLAAVSNASLTNPEYPIVVVKKRRGRKPGPKKGKKAAKK